MLVFVRNTQGDSFNKPDAKTVFQLIFPVSAHCLKFGEGRLFRERKVTETRDKERVKALAVPMSRIFRRNLPTGEQSERTFLLGLSLFLAFFVWSATVSIFLPPGFWANIVYCLQYRSDRTF